MKFSTHTPEETIRLGVKIGENLQAGDLVLLFGDLGSGKTTLTQGIARGLGVAENEYVRSPSFTLINEYRGRIPIFHIDLYRIESASQLENLGLEEILFGEGISIVEWAEKLFPDNQKDSLIENHQPRIEISLEFSKAESREIEISLKNQGTSDHPIFTLQ
ncbi:MAG: tRNA (adenosine(37)-N6)-threonylcarbamoyltransferase complex ATPase subunit type 1 TsaE [Nitrospina sp.]|nr:MAG: tRNA (adenosine(37)-N6)-threonylcarbamoyltransferase complex ATPase subunit type 1 TsaE [Nitrospina sp.]TDJ59548.1 MAG: tRNA (adenosine(37)-N6)-threonylcarbamoyltransferase complex ATPase subunit type 1 TsaE [Nitrospina sp.]